MIRATAVEAEMRAAQARVGSGGLWRRALLVAALLFVFFVGIRGMGVGFRGLGHDLLASFFAATENPFVGLSLGLLGTTLMQSSSVMTSMIVAMVAAPSDPLPIANAIPMVMGANIGTTVTNTLVAMGHIGRPDEFRRALSTATCHDFFNLLTAAILLPLELTTSVLQRASGFISGAFVGIGGTELANPFERALSACVEPLYAVLRSVSGNVLAAAGMTLLSVVLIFSCLTLIVRTLRDVSATRLKTYVTRSLDAHPLVGIIVGIVVTIMVQSSSITTSVLVPLAGAGLVTLRQVFPITLGANIGTTITALIASMAAPPETARLAIQIATVHLLFNLIGVASIYPLAPLRGLPILAAQRLASIAVRSRKTAVVYLVLLFYGIPGVLILAWRLF